MFQYIILNIYLACLIIIGIFSLETLYLTFKYWRGAKKSDIQNRNKSLPVVTVQLPVYNEQYVAERLIHSVCSLTYPIDKLQIQVLDDSTDYTIQICREQVALFKEKGFDIDHIQRAERTGFKAGALREGLEKARGDLIAIFDADFIPGKDFLLNTVHHFQDPQVGMVQTRWDHLNENYSLLTRAQAFGLSGHFVVEQNGRHNAGCFISFNGTAGIWRKACIEDAGNWQDDTLTEDLDLSYRAQIKGWKFIFNNEVPTLSELPAEINALKGQQYRWTKGAIETARKIVPQLWRSNHSLFKKVHGTLHLMGNMVYPVIFLLALLNLPLILIKQYLGQTEIYFAIYTFFMISFATSFIFYLLSQKALHNDWLSRMLLFPIFMSGSMGFSVNNSWAFVQGFLKKRTPFLRTPKYHLVGKTGTIEGKKYSTKLDTVVYLEIFMAVYSCVAVLVAVHYIELGILPFLVMFLIGFSISGFLSITHYLKINYRRI
jgi:cellulose synthase/poly-beta-1,6-N-acetylglucosamine synthase-like glycosyltransferase